MAHGVKSGCAMWSFGALGRCLHGKTNALLLHAQKERSALVHKIHKTGNSLCDGNDHGKGIDGACKSLSSRVMKLYRQLGAMLVKALCHLAHGLDVIIMAHGKLRIGGGSCHIVDSADAGNDKSNAAFGALFVIIRKSLCNLAAGLPKTEFSSCHDYPVFDSHSANVHWRKHYVVHKYPLEQYTSTFHYDRSCQIIEGICL